MCFVYPGPSLPATSSARTISTSTKFKDRFKYGDSSRRTSASEKGSVLLKAVAAPSCAIRFYRDINHHLWGVRRYLLTLKVCANGITLLSLIKPAFVNASLTFASSTAPLFSS
jgi:hypothetical protein